MRIKLFKILPNVLLLIVSFLFSLVLAEMFLRLAYPKYKLAAESRQIVNSTRVWETAPNSKFFHRHPDLGTKILIIYNSLGLRQHREFALKKPEGVIRIGLFGDSNLENRNLEVQYSLTEPLDYLLNKTGKKFEVLNFGTSGYGPEQEYMYYLQEGVRLGLDVVFLVYCENDLKDSCEVDLLEIDKEENIKLKPFQNNKFNLLINKFHITYLIINFRSKLEEALFGDNDVMDQKKSSFQKKARRRVSKMRKRHRCKNIRRKFYQGIITPDVSERLDIFMAILSKMKNMCKDSGGQFYIATWELYRKTKMSGFLKQRQYEVIDFFDKFDSVKDRSTCTFKNDGHWNEEGNKLAAVFLFKFLADKLSIDYNGDAFIEQSLYEYYSSFDLSRVSNIFLRQHFDFPSTLKDDIRDRYLALE